jgi:hypothetical protein
VSKSITRRLSKLETRCVVETPKSGPGYLLAWCEKLSRTDPDDRPEGFTEAWESYVPVRDQVISEGSAPPDHFQPDLDATTRVELWLKWGHPTLNEVVEGLLSILVGWRDSLLVRDSNAPKRGVRVG